MSDCPFLAACPFFNDRLANMPTVSGYLKKEYCNSDYTLCARFTVRNEVGVENVPIDMFPNEQKRAQEIIARVKFRRGKNN